eukprot:316205-Prymnesium_polylepis.1
MLAATIPFEHCAADDGADDFDEQAGAREPARKRARCDADDEPAAQRLCALAAVAEEPSDEMDAALALSGMIGTSHARTESAQDLARFPTTNQFFPCTAGKG